jgi:hypothetical protein
MHLAQVGTAYNSYVYAARTIDLDRMSHAESDTTVLVSIDYQHKELRVLAHFSNDARLCKMCSDTSIDPYKAIASCITSKAIHSVTDDERQVVLALARPLPWQNAELLHCAGDEEGGAGSDVCFADSVFDCAINLQHSPT